MELSKNEARVLIEHYAGLITSGIPASKALNRMQELNQLIELQEPIPFLGHLDLGFVLGMLENLREGSHRYIACTKPFEITKRFLERKEYVGKKTAGGTSPKSANTLKTLLQESVKNAKKKR